MRVKIEKWGRVTGGRVSEWRWVKTTRVLFLIGPGCPQRGAANERERERRAWTNSEFNLKSLWGSEGDRKTWGRERERQ